MRAWAVLAMAQTKRGAADLARTALARAQDVPPDYPTFGSADLQPGWHDWLTEQVLLGEAKTTIDALQGQQSVL